MKKALNKLLATLLATPLLSAGALVAIPAVVSAECSTGDNLTLRSGADCAKGEGQQEELFGEAGVVKKITDVLLFLIGSISVIMMIYGGVQYVISGGDSTKVQNAKNTILYAVVGIIVAILAYALSSFVITQFASEG